MDAYKGDLAYIHDVGFGGFSKGAAPGLLEILRRNGTRTGLVVDLGCGSGLWARALCDAGYEVHGIDISAAMVNLARERVPEARFRRGSFLKVKLPPCEAVTSLGECPSYLFDGGHNKGSLGRLFRRVHAALKPGGLFVFDIAEPGRGAGPRMKHWEGADWAVLIDVEENEKAKRLTRRITTFRKVGRTYRRDQEVHRLRLYKGSEVAVALRRVGFRVRVVRGYGRWRFPEELAGFVARKP